MKFTDGFWQLRPGSPRCTRRRPTTSWRAGSELVRHRADQGDRKRGATPSTGPTLTVTRRARRSPGVIGVRVEHFQGGADQPASTWSVRRRRARRRRIAGDGRHADIGDLTRDRRRRAPRGTSASPSDGRILTRERRARRVGYMQLAPDAQVDHGPVGNARAAIRGRSPPTYLHEQLDLGGRRARLRPRRALRAARQERPDRRHLERRRRHLERAGLQERAVLPDQPRLRRAGQPPGPRLVRGRLRGGRARAVLGARREPGVLRHRRPDPRSRCSSATRADRPARAAVPAWSYGLWLSTSFTTDYDEATVDELHRRHGRARPAAQRLPLRLLLDARVQLVRLRVGRRASSPTPRACSRGCTSKDLQVCVWINPYIAQRSPLFAEAPRLGLPGETPERRRLAVGPLAGRHGPRRFHQPGCHGLVPGQAARPARPGRRLLQDRLRRAHPARGRLLRRLRARSACTTGTRSCTTGGVRGARAGSAAPARPCCSRARRPSAASGCRCTGAATRPRPTSRWPRPCAAGCRSRSAASGSGATTSAASRAPPTPAVFKRWTAFGLLSSHSRLHGSSSYRVPWAFDDGRGRERGRGHAGASRSSSSALMPYLLRGRARGDARGIAGDAADAARVPRRPGRRVTSTGSTCWAPTCWSRRSSTARGEVEFYLPAGALDELLHRREPSRAAAGAARRTASTPCRSTCARARSSRSARAPTGPTTTTSTGSSLEVFPGPRGHARRDRDDPRRRHSVFTVVRCDDGVVVSLADHGRMGRAGHRQCHSHHCDRGKSRGRVSDHRHRRTTATAASNSRPTSSSARRPRRTRSRVRCAKTAAARRSGTPSATPPVAPSTATPATSPTTTTTGSTPTST